MEKGAVSKVCKKCGIEKSINEFSKHKFNKDGHFGSCKKCESMRGKEYRSRPEVKERIKAYREKYKEKNRKRAKEYWKEYSKRPSTIKRRREYSQRPEVKLRNCITTRLRNAIKLGENNSWSGDPGHGLSIEELKDWLEYNFYPNPKTGEQMTWDNYGRGGWVVDHVIPLPLFDLSNERELKEACYWVNLQPMWGFENWSKYNKLPV